MTLQALQKFTLQDCYRKHRPLTACVLSSISITFPGVIHKASNKKALVSLLLRCVSRLCTHLKPWLPQCRYILYTFSCFYQVAGPFTISSWGDRWRVPGRGCPVTCPPREAFTSKYTDTHAHIYAHIHTRIHRNAYVHLHTHTFSRAHTYTETYTYALTHAHTHSHTRIHTHSGGAQSFNSIKEGISPQRYLWKLMGPPCCTFLNFKQRGLSKTLFFQTWTISAHYIRVSKHVCFHLRLNVLILFVTLATTVM